MLKKRKNRLYDAGDNAWGYLFILPFLIGFFAFTIIPIGTSLYYSFTDYDVLGTPEFIGFANYIKMFTRDPKFLTSFWVTIKYVVASVPLRLVFALLVAMLLKVSTKATSFYRAVYYLPSIMGGSIAVAVLWKRMFGNDGIINSLLSVIGIDLDFSWIGNPNTALTTLVILAVWQFGSSMLIFLAGLKQIPASYYEVASIDGAGPIRKFFKITLPMLTPVIFFNLIMQLISGFMAFTQSFIITGGEPLDRTLFIALYMYRRAFQYNEMGYGCAIAWIMLIAIALLTALIFKTSGRWVYYEAKE